MTTLLQQHLGKVIFFGNFAGVNTTPAYKKQAIFNRVALEFVEIVRKKFEAKEAWRINSNSRRRIALFTGANASLFCKGLSHGDKKNAQYTAGMDGIWSDLGSVKTAPELLSTITASKYLTRAFGEVISTGQSLMYVTAAERLHLVSAMIELHLIAKTSCSSNHQIFAEMNFAASYGTHRKVLTEVISQAETIALSANVKNKRELVTPKIL